MRRIALLALAGLPLLTAPAGAAVSLIAKGSISGKGLDLSGLTNTLENGASASMLGGLGSGLAYAGGNTFIATPDRGPNAVVYNKAIDNTVSYINRFDTLTLGLTASTSGGLPFMLTPELNHTTLLFSPTPLTYGTGTAYNVPNGAPAQNDASHYYFTGRSDNYGAGDSGNAMNARFDPEGVRVSNDGKSIFVSDEYGPYVRQFDRETGELQRTFTLPADLDVAKLAPTTDGEAAPNNLSGRVANKGMEGLSITPDGKTLVGIMQAPLIQDAADPATKSMVRIVTIDIASGKTAEYGYNLTTGSGVSEIVALSATQFLVDERDGKGKAGADDGSDNNAKVKSIFEIDISKAQDITGKTGGATAVGLVQQSATPFLDLVAALKANGYKADQIPAKIEGLAFGDDVMLNGELLHTLYIANDNDFLPNTAGDNQFFVFGFTDADLPGFTPQQFSQSAVPEPATWAMMIGGFGLVGASLRRRRLAVRFQ